MQKREEIMLFIITEIIEFIIEIRKWEKWCLEHQEMLLSTSVCPHSGIFYGDSKSRSYQDLPVKSDHLKTARNPLPDCQETRQAPSENCPLGTSWTRKWSDHGNGILIVAPSSRSHINCSKVMARFKYFHLDTLGLRSLETSSCRPWTSWAN